MISLSPVLVLAHAGLSSAAIGQTDLTTSLNNQIKKGTKEVFRTGGKGVLVRTPDFLDDDPSAAAKVVPATFWHNDIHAVSQLYPSGNPWCPNDGSDGFERISWMSCSDHAESATTGPWNYATVAVVVGSQMKNLMTDFDSIQHPDWGYGVFYSMDSNSGDKRCLWAYEYNGWDCPGGWINEDGSYVANPDKKGAGNFAWGNMDAGGGGGGSGCHFDTGTNLIDQADAYDAQGQNLVLDYACQCNYAFNDNWDKWVTNWIDNSQQKSGFEWRSWLHGGAKAPTWAVDTAICWMNNPKDMIDLQNALWARRTQWNNQLAPKSAYGGSADEDRRYWGWNEVPADRSAISDKSNWDAVIIKLPANICGSGKADSATCLDTDALKTLDSDLHDFVKNGRLVPGLKNVNKKPGSSVVFVREVETTTDKWEREFFCEDFTTQSYKIVYKSSSTSACYIDTKTAVTV